VKKKSASQSAFLHPRLLIGLFVLLAGVVLGMFAIALAKPAPIIGQRQNVKATLHGAGQDFWAQTNGPQGGDGLALATNASGHVFVGTQGGGVFRSTDNAETWTAVNNGLTSTNVRALAITLASYIFAGTFDAGIFRSSDNGDNWTAANNGLGSLLVRSLVTNSAGDVFAGTFGGGVYRSTDNGDEFFRMS
jgi:photosystem II stability/assembly factor-like uncharacterized protein